MGRGEKRRIRRNGLQRRSSPERKIGWLNLQPTGITEKKFNKVIIRNWDAVTETDGLKEIF